MSVIFNYIQRVGWSKKFQFIGLASLHLLQVVSADGTKSTSLFIENKDGVMSLRSNLRGLSTQNIAKDVPDFLSHGKLSSILMNNFEDMTQFTSSEEIQLAWEDSVVFEWYRAEQEEERMGELRLEGTEDVVRGTTSFLICMSGSESGYNRKEILKKTMASLGDSATLDKDLLYNKDDFTCVFSTMTASEARMVQQGNDNIIIQPLPALTKISVNALSSMRNGINPDERTSTVIMSFCPGIDESTALAENLVRRVQVGLDTSSMSSEGSARKLISEDFLWTSPQINEDGMNTSWITRRALVYRSILDKVIADPSSNCTESLKDIIVTSSSGSHQFLSFELPNEDNEEKSCSDAFILGLSVQPEVCRVERKFRARLLNANAQWILQSHSEGERPFWDAGIKGQNQIVQVSDSGLDTNNCYFWDSSAGELKDGTVQPTRRKVVQYYPLADDSDPEGGHGTHVVGTIIGKKSVDGTVNGEGEGLADGVAIEGKVAFFDLGDGDECCFGANSGMFQVGIAAGAYVHSGSWGSLTNAYDSQTKDYDDFMYNNEDFIALFAAGNKGAVSGKDTLNTTLSPSQGKNVIAVGATESHGNDLHAGFQGGTDYVAVFSSRGPTFDGRIKPDIMAPGYAILSACARPGESGECDPDYLMPSFDLTKNAEELQEEGLTYMQGTSMATPAASGATLLIRQYLQEGFYPTGAKVAGHEIPNPSGSLLKAILINGGQALYAVNNIPYFGFDGGITLSQMYDEHQGFGRVNLLNSLSLSGKNNLKAYIKDKVLINDGDSHTYQFKLGANPESTCELIRTISATIVWADPPASLGCASCVLNDLDLLVEIESLSQTYYPNGKTEKDSINNVERFHFVYDDGNYDPTFKLSVKAHNLSGASQKYALVVTGCGLARLDTSSPTPNPTPNPSSISDSPSEKPSASPFSKPSASPSSKPSSSPSFKPFASPSSSDDDCSRLFPLVKSLFKGEGGKNHGRI